MKWSCWCFADDVTRFQSSGSETDNYNWLLLQQWCCCAAAAAAAAWLRLTKLDCVDVEEISQARRQGLGRCAARRCAARRRSTGRPVLTLMSPRLLDEQQQQQQQQHRPAVRHTFSLSARRRRQSFGNTIHWHWRHSDATRRDDAKMRKAFSAVAGRTKPEPDSALASSYQSVTGTCLLYTSPSPRD